MAAPSTADHSAETLRQLAKRMADFENRFKQLAESWESDGFGVLAVTRDDQRKKAIDFLNNFGRYVEAALDGERERTGKMVVKSSDGAQAKRKKKES